MSIKCVFVVCSVTFVIHCLGISGVVSTIIIKYFCLLSCFCHCRCLEKWVMGVMYITTTTGWYEHPVILHWPAAHWTKRVLQLRIQRAVFEYDLQLITTLRAKGSGRVDTNSKMVSDNSASSFECNDALLDCLWSALCTFHIMQIFLFSHTRFFNS